MSDLVRRIGSDESGAMIVTVLFCFPLLIAFGIFVVDVGNAFEHRRHLQLQADAGVLAAGQDFTRCFLDANAANAAITQTARNYGGEVHNPQIGGPNAQSRVLTVTNSAGYDGPSDGLGEPCDTGFIDMKVTDQDVPAIFSIFGLHDYHAHARLRVLQLESSDRLLPIAAEDPVPRWAAAIFVNEQTGAEIARTTLTPNGFSGGLAQWDNSTAPLAVPINAEHVGVRIALSGKTGGGNCGDALVVCYDAGSANQGLVHIRGWSSEGTVAAGNPPIARNVALYSTTCATPYFTSAACTFGVRASANFSVAPANSNLTAKVGGTNYPLTFDSATGTWATGTVIPAAAGTGPVNVELLWEQTSGTVGSDTCRTNGGNKCTGTFGALQRTFGAVTARSGPIGAVGVTESGTPITGSFQRCSASQPSCTHSLVVSVGIKGALELSQIGGPPVRLRIVQDNGASQNQSLDCDPGRSNLKDELWLGCRPRYSKNTGTACPGSANALWSSPQPWSCVANQTGQAANQIAEGLNCRILMNVPDTGNCNGKPGSCTHPNKWPDVQSGDPRIVYVIVTPFGSFNGSGSNTVPVLRLAAFYITGWMGQGNGFQNPCLNAGDEMPLDNAEIVGRFIKFIETPNTGGTTNEPCDLTDPSAVDVCAAVLVE